MPPLAERFPALLRDTEVMQANAQWARNQEGTMRPPQTPLQDDASGEPVYKRMRTVLGKIQPRSQEGLQHAIDACASIIQEGPVFRRCAWCGDEAAIHVDTKWGEMCAACDERHGIAMETRDSLWAVDPDPSEGQPPSPPMGAQRHTPGRATDGASEAADACMTHLPPEEREAIERIYQMNGLRPPGRAEGARRRGSEAQPFRRASY